MTDSQDQASDARGDFERFYAESVKRLVTVVYAVTGDLGEAEDAVQEAYARAWPRWEQLVEQGDPTPWVRTVALRLAVSTWRRARNRLRAHFRHGPPPDLPGLAPDHVALVAALRHLSPEQRRAVVLHHLLDLPVEEVARETGSTSTAVRSRLMRARRVLSSQLTDSPETSTARTGRTPTAAQPRQEVLPHE
ncbi:MULTISPECIES: SigE family RNA polymerase sigma factor [Streptomyces]|uniref:ECF subfamily RNA polymerase sigma factor n=1 Tax=Streptomyces zinciresistens K42 TaxID=700597 RepID=G2G5X0_9ACTN|nr:MULTISPECIES: SigE family RNA polymerase sigma factor [Streptomyces]EGX61059.1 ECF subfamily RNA polymerase sigma factor [Streptomyces zinciresistens K42]MDT9696583.1 SigE family RNA polymerase sigma factor [Streptomyces sp. P17]